MQTKTYKSFFLRIAACLCLAFSFSSCHIDEPGYNYVNYIEGTYSIQGYVYPLSNTNIQYVQYYNLGLDIDWAGYNQAYVSVYNSYDFFMPFYNLKCKVTYDYREDAYSLYNPSYPYMTLLVYPDGYVYMDFPYVDYNRRDCGYVFWGYLWY